MLYLFNAFACGLCFAQIFHNIAEGNLGLMIFNICFCIINALFAVGGYISKRNK